MFKNITICAYLLLLGMSLCHLTFLGEMKIESYEKKLANFNLTPLDAEDFLNGYFSGLELFNNVAYNSTCFQNGEIIIEDALKLYEILKDIKIDISIISKIKNILVLTKNIVSSFTGEIEQCQEASDVILDDIHNIIDRVRKDKYLEDLGAHLVLNLAEIKTLIQTGFADFHEGKMKEAGQSFGKATKFVAFWDLTNKNNTN